MSARVRVLVVDDSAFARKVLRTVLAGSDQIELVGIARDGLEAIERIQELKPDVITLDLIMPGLDGIGLLRALPSEGAPRVVVVSTADVDSELAVTALQLGAIDLVRKPTALATDRLYELGEELVAKVLQAARARAPSAKEPVAIEPVAIDKESVSTRAARSRLLVVGASTGGPQAVTRLLSALPLSFPVPIVVALHIPAGYTDALAARLNEVCQLQVREAHEGLELAPGMAVIARGGEHALIRGQGSRLSVHLDLEPRSSLYFPSVDLLFESAVRALDSKVLGVVLTGMGDDGRRGAGAIRRAGGSVLTEAESSCVIYGMPRSVVEAGYSNDQAPLDQLPRLIGSYL